MKKINVTPIRWLLLDDRFFGVYIFIEARPQPKGKIKYSIISDNSFFLNESNLEFCLNQKDDEVFLKETRFNSFQKALSVYKKFIRKHLKNKTTSTQGMAIQFQQLGQILDRSDLTEKRIKFKL